jgi:hypothetical protein
MSLNNIEFSKKNIADLYKNTLVEFDESADLSNSIARDSLAVEKSQYKFLGENRRNVLIVVNYNYSDAVHIPEKQLSFLTNLLTACKLNLGDIALLNFHQYATTDFTGIISYFKPTTVFLFGVNPADFGLPLLFPHFQVQSFKDSSYLFAPSLQETEPDKILKSKLWVCLKKIFNL